jgi:hypothetical protein
MSIDAVAVLPPAPPEMPSKTLEAPWEESAGPGVATLA